MKALLIDDSATVRHNVGAILQGLGFTVATAQDGFAALAMIVDYQPHVILLDANMPRLDGYQTCSLIKNNQNYRTIPVLLMANRASLCDKAQADLAGVDAYLTKPFSRDEIITALESVAALPTSAIAEAEL